MGKITCLNTTKVTYTFPLLNYYCKSEQVVCVSYHNDYAENKAVIKSNLASKGIGKMNFYSDQCLAKNNFKNADPYLLKQMNDLVPKTNEQSKDHTNCLYLMAAKTALEIILDNIMLIFAPGHVKTNPDARYTQNIENYCKQQDVSNFIGIEDGDFGNNLPAFVDGGTLIYDALHSSKIDL